MVTGASAPSWTPGGDDRLRAVYAAPGVDDDVRAGYPGEVDVVADVDGRRSGDVTPLSIAGRLFRVLSGSSPCSQGSPSPPPLSSVSRPGPAPAGQGCRGLAHHVDWPWPPNRRKRSSRRSSATSRSPPSSSSPPAFTGSSAMISEGIHSLVDTGNGILLYHGLRRGARPPDEHHPFGHGMEVYFWSLIVAISIFAVGGGMSIYEGITPLIHPAPLENPVHQLHRLGPLRGLRGHLVHGRLAGLRRRRGARAAWSPRSARARTPACSPWSSRTPPPCSGCWWRSWGCCSATCSTARTRRRRLGGHRPHPGDRRVWLAEESRSLLVGEVADPEIVAALRGDRPDRPGRDGPRRGAHHASRPRPGTAEHRGPVQARGYRRRGRCGRSPDRAAHPASHTLK